MLELVGLGGLTLNLMFILFFAGMLIQCLLVYFTLMGTQPNKIVVAFEALLLCFLAWISWFIGILKDNLFNGLILLPGADLRLALIPVVILGFLLTVRIRRLRFALSALMLLLLLPIFDGILGGMLGLRLAASGAPLILLSLIELANQIADFRKSITGLSVKEALDQLPDGMLFAGSSGRPVSVNRQAQKIIGSLSLSPYDHIDVLWEKLVCHPDRVKGDDTPDGLLICLKEGPCFYLLKYPIEIKHRHFTQLYLRDITREFCVSRQIESENRRLEKNALELKRLLELAEENAWRKEILDSRARLHDILSQRLSLTHVLLSGLDKKPVEKLFEEIKGHLASIEQDLFYEPELTPQVRLEQLVQLYRTIGIDIVREGRLPASDKISDVFVKILREAFSNALRHAGATRIFVRFDEGGSGHEMTVSNNGYCPSEPPKEGNGIQNMRARLESFDGSLMIKTECEFVIRICVPFVSHE
ncbi:MAG: sensor histidine kinase [Syntrophomonadaceae bacterium]|jgi:signal transduction histidine kinase